MPPPDQPSRSAGSWATIMSWPNVTSWPCAEVQAWQLRCESVAEAATHVAQPKLPADHKRRVIWSTRCSISLTPMRSDNKGS